MIKPYFVTYPNPLIELGWNLPDGFTHYEIQTVREYQQPGGEPFFEVVTDEEYCEDDCPEAIGPVLFGVYGRLAWGGAESICDRRTLVDAEELLRKMGVIA